MPKIRCHYNDCAFLDDGYCSAALVEINPDNGCLTTADRREEHEMIGRHRNEEWEELEEESERKMKFG